MLLSDKKQKLVKMRWNPGNLVYYTGSKCHFWKHNSEPVILETVQYKERILQYLKGQSGFHVVLQNQPIMFLGIRQIEVFDEQNDCKTQHYVLQFLDKEQIIFLDSEVLKHKDFTELFGFFSKEIHHA